MEQYLGKNSIVQCAILICIVETAFCIMNLSLSKFCKQGEVSLLFVFRFSLFVFQKLVCLSLFAFRLSEVSLLFAFRFSSFRS